MYALTASLACPERPVSLKITSRTVAAVVCDAEAPCSVKNSTVPLIVFHHIASQYHSSFVLLELFVQSEWQNAHSRFLTFLGVSPLLYCSLLIRPKPVVSAMFPIPCRVPQGFSLLSVWESVRAPCCSAKWKHDLRTRCGLYFAFLYSVWFESFASMIRSSGSLFEHEEFSLFVSILDRSLALGRPKLEPSGWLVWWPCKRHLLDPPYLPEASVGLRKPLLLTKCFLVLL